MLSGGGGGESDSGEAIEIATIKLNALHQRGVPLNGLIYLLQKRMILGFFALWIIFTVGILYTKQPFKIGIIRLFD